MVEQPSDYSAKKKPTKKNIKGKNNSLKRIYKKKKKKLTSRKERGATNFIVGAYQV